MTTKKKTTDFLSYFPGHMIQYIDDRKKNSKLGKTADELNLTEAEQKQKQGAGVYFSLNAFKGRRNKQSLIAYNGVAVDLDVAKEGDLNNKKSISAKKKVAFEKLSSFKAIPHFIIETKNGLQAIWLIDDIKDEKSYLALSKGLAVHFHADLGGISSTRVLRVPGFLHLKNPEDPFLCELRIDNSHKPHYKQSELAKLLPDTANKNSEPSTPQIDNPIAEASELPIEEAIVKAAAVAGIKIEFRKNPNGSKQIIENGETTSGYISCQGKFVYSPSGKNRKGDIIDVAEYYINEVGGNRHKRPVIARMLLEPAAPGSPAAPLPVLSLKELRALPLKPIRYIVDQLLPENGITMIQGNPGSYKTWFALYLAYCILHGKKVLNLFECTLTNILLINQDDDIRATKGRLDKIGFSNNPGLFIWQEQQEYFSLSGDIKQPRVEALISFIKDNKIGLVIIDTFRDIHHADENSSHEMSKIMQILKRISSDCSIILIHHLSKDTRSKLLGGRGSTVITGGLISLIGLYAQSDGVSTMLIHLKNKIGRFIKSVILNFNEDGEGENLFTASEPKEKVNPDSIAEIMLQDFRDSPRDKYNKDEYTGEIAKKHTLPKLTSEKAFGILLDKKILIKIEETHQNNKIYYRINESSDFLQ